MTYKEIVDRIGEVAKDHRMIADFGYGNLSDIKAQEEVNYPYLFLNPTTHARTEQTLTYRFNLIMMDMCNDETYLKIQSQCQQYIDDVLAHLTYHYKDQVDLQLNITLTPFKERFQDVVAGMTATIEMELPAALSDCYTPFDLPPAGVLDVYSTERQRFRPELSQLSPQRFQATVIDTYDAMRKEHPGDTARNYYNITQTGLWTFRHTGTMTLALDEGLPTSGARMLGVRYRFGGRVDIIAPTFTNFPENPVFGESYDYVCEYPTLDLATTGPDQVEYITIFDPNDPPVEAEYYVEAGATLTATYDKNY
jgi:hypothetical protein